MIKPAIALLASAALVPAVFADLEAEARAALEAARRPLTLDAGELGGPGGAWLLEHAARAQFTLIGESHLNAETPALTGALLSGLKPAGYSAYIVECGPESTRLLMDAVREGGVEAGEAVLTDLPFTIAFLDQREEMRVAADAMAGGYSVWGIDQEFMGSARFLLRRLTQIAPDDASREIAQGMYDRAKAGFGRFASSGDPSGAFMSTAAAEDFDALDRAFTGDEARRIIHQLRASAAVYRAYAQQRYYDNNAMRVDLIRRNFLDHLRRAGETAPPQRKAVIKAGSVHCGRGRTPMHVFDIGALAAELAFANGGESFHVNVLAKGSVNAIGLFNSWLDQAPYLAPLFELTPDDTPVVFDLRPLRPLLTQRGGKSKELQDLQDLALRYDAVVMYPRFHRADAIVAMPGR